MLVRNIWQYLLNIINLFKIKFSNMEKDFEKYFKRIEASFEEKLNKDRAVFLPILNQLKKFYILTSFISDYFGKVDYQAKNQGRAIFTLYNKSALDTFAVYSCLMNGLEIQTTIIIRSLFENYINTLLVLEKESEVFERCKLYDDFQHVLRWTHIKKSEENVNQNISKSSVFSSTDIENAKDCFEKIYMNYCPDKPKHWAWKIFKDNVPHPNKFNPSLYYICNHLNKLEDYHRLYSTFSLSTHSASIIGNHFTTEDEEFSISVNSPKFSISTVSYSFITMDYCIEIIKEILKFTKIKRYEELIKYLGKFHKESLDIVNRYSIN